MKGIDISSLRMPFNKRESYLIVSEFQMDYPLSSVQPMLDMMKHRNYTPKILVNEKPEIQITIKKAADAYESMRQNMLNQMLKHVVQKRRTSTPKSNLELLEQMLEKTKVKCMNFIRKRMNERMIRRYFFGLLPPKTRRKKRKSEAQLTRKNIKKRKIQKEKKTNIKKQRQEARKINFLKQQS